MTTTMTKEINNNSNDNKGEGRGGGVKAQEKLKRAAVGPLPGVTQDIAGFKIAHKPSIYVLDSPGVLVPSISDIKTGLKLALAGEAVCLIPVLSVAIGDDGIGVEDKESSKDSTKRLNALLLVDVVQPRGLVAATTAQPSSQWCKSALQSVLAH
ncbi:hypothetical protein VIGAN_04276200 [Vigna angularis var. angularis]|uniref:G domain-containing protein n=1 Tax=Vigna angularis var. angularis TaxID=157739 RepID=A0A0S3RXB7_PHAAN|nr:hypothetical protein VIGAN_04276200 [Vigna angularis var. angularis]